MDSRPGEAAPTPLPSLESLPSEALELALQVAASRICADFPNTAAVVSEAARRLRAQRIAGKEPGS